MECSAIYLPVAGRPRAFYVFNRLEKKLFPREVVSRDTGTSGHVASNSSDAMAEITAS